MTTTRHVLLALGVLMTSCVTVESPPFAHYNMTVVPVDLRTAYGTDSIRDNYVVRLPEAALVVNVSSTTISGLDPSLVAALREAIWLVRLDTGQRVPGEVREGLFAPDGEALTPSSEWRGFGFSFVPSAPLADGWYVFVFEFGPLAAGRSLNVSGGYQERGLSEDITVSRFHVGSRPTWSNIYMQCQEFPDRGSPACRLEAWWSEAIELPSDTVFNVLADGEPVACSQTNFAFGTNLECAYQPDGTEFTIALRSSVITGADGGLDPQVVIADWRPFSAAGGRPCDPTFGMAEARASQ